MPQTAEQIEPSDTSYSGRLEGVPKEALFEVWPLVGSLIADAINRNTGAYSLEEVFQRLLNDHMQLWVYLKNGDVKACCVTQIENRSYGRTCVLYCVAGSNMAEWLPLDEMFAEWARMHNCVALECLGRKGWERVLKDWNKVAVVMRKEL